MLKWVEDLDARLIRWARQGAASSPAEAPELEQGSSETQSPETGAAR